MADEITILNTLKLANGFLIEDLSEPSQTIDQASPKMVKHVQDITTSAEVLVVGEVTSPGWGFFKNLGTEGDIDLQLASGSQAFATLKVGQPGFSMPLKTSTLYAQGSAGTNKLFFCIFAA